MSAIPKPIRETDSRYGDFVRRRPCLIQDFWYVTDMGKSAQHVCFGAVEAHHVIPAGGGKTGSKVSDRRQLPFCETGHRIAQRRDKFVARYGIDLEAEILRLNAEFDALYGPKRTRRKPMKVEEGVNVKNCTACGRSHFSDEYFSNGRFKITRFRCKVKNQWVEAE